MIDIVSFANKNNSGLVNFLKSFEKFNGWNLNIIGKNMKWKGWITRMNSYRDFAKQSNPDKLLVLLDAFDVLCINHSNDFEKKFNQINKKYIFGCEYNCNIIGGNCKKPKNWQKINNIYNLFVNGGCIIAKAKDIVYLWDWCINNNHTIDDQKALGYFMDDHPFDVFLDINKIFVHNDLYGYTDLSIQENQIFLDNKKLSSYFIHFPGLMIYNSIAINYDLGSIPKNYILVVDHILKNEAIKEFPINSFIYKISLIICIMIIFLLMLFFIILYIIKK